MNCNGNVFAAMGWQILGASATPAPEVRPLLERLWYAQGLAHPIIVHIPIALLLAAAIAAAWKIVSRRGSNPMIYFCLFLGTGGAIMASLAGWAWAPQKDGSYVDPFDKASDIFWHRWGGVAVAALSLIVLIWATITLRRKVKDEHIIAAMVKAAEKEYPNDQEIRLSPRMGGYTARSSVLKAVEDAAVQGKLKLPSQTWWQLAVIAVAALTGFVGHQGGELVYPDNMKHIFAIASGEEPVRLKGQKKENPPKDKAWEASAVSPTPSNNLTTKPTVPATSRTDVATGTIDFSKQIAPIFQEKCVYCHGSPDKNKGKLRVDTEKFCLQGGTDDGPLYKAGDPDGSSLIKRVTDTDTDNVMPPPKEKKAVTPEELKLLKQWIAEGAKWNIEAVPPK